MTKFRTCVWGREILVLTDHNPLQYLYKHRDTASRLIRWALKLQEFNLKIVYRKGKANGNADALSRMPEETKDQVVTETVFEVTREIVNLDKVKELQGSDEELQMIIENMQKKDKNIQKKEKVQNL